MKESRASRKLRARIARGGLPIGYDLYNEADINDIAITITTQGHISLDRIGTILIFEVSEDER